MEFSDTYRKNIIKQKDIHTSAHLTDEVGLGQTETSGRMYH